MYSVRAFVVKNEDGLLGCLALSGIDDWTHDLMINGNRGKCST